MHHLAHAINYILVCELLWPKVVVTPDQLSRYAPRKAKTPRHERQNGHPSRSLGLVPTIVHGSWQSPHRNPPYKPNLQQYRFFASPYLAIEGESRDNARLAPGKITYLQGKTIRIIFCAAIDQLVRIRR